MRPLTFSLLTLFSLAFFPSFYHPVFTKDEKPPYLTKEFTLNDDGTLNVKTSGGSITVLGQSGNQVKVEMYVRKNGGGSFSSEDDIKEALEDYKISITKEGNAVNAVAEKQNKTSWKNSANISFKVYVPNKINCDLKTSGGSINVAKVIGNQDVNTSGGGLDLVSIRGNLKAHTSGGGIDIKNFKGDLDAHTSGGSIDVNEAKGNIKVHTSGGSIELKEVYGSIDADTSGGSIDADIKEITKFLSLHTSGGSINATIPAGLGLDLDLKGNAVHTKLTNFSGEAKKDKIEGKLNGGGIPVNLSTSGGSVSLNYSM
jgi:hypothetical protein